jgi:serine/threonine protein kinase
MPQATSCPSAPVLQRLLLGQSADEESVSLEAHLLHCDKCLQTIKSLPPDDALISSLQEGRNFATLSPRSELLEKLRLRLQEMPVPSGGLDTATAENTNPNAPFPSPELLVEESVALAPPQQPDEIGRLGGYRVLKELGRGGMGAVFQAEDPKLKRLVALKVMLPRLAADASARRRFLREAQAMAAVHHDHVVTIYQVDEDNGVPFLAMEFLHGTPLDKWLKDGRKPNLAQILRMGREIAEGLAAAHARGLIHRDIKPGNIWLDSDHKDRVKILDFGLARVGTDDVHLTRSGAIVGTPAYMSPEQGAGQKVDARTDLFSLGCILYRFCTGAMPFAGDTTMALLTALAVADPKPVRELNPDIPAPLADLVMRLLAKKPADRPASAQEVAEQIESIEKNPQGVKADQTEILAPETQALPLLAKPRSRRRTAVYALVGAAAALILAAGGAVVYVQTDRGTLEIRTSDPDVKVSVSQNGAEVDVLDPKSKQQLSIHSGKYTLKLTGVDGADHEMVIDQGTNPVTLTRGGKVVVTVNRVDKVHPAAVAVNSSSAPLDEAWVKKVRDLPAEKQVKEVAAELKRRNPGFDGKLTPTITNGVDLTGLALSADEVADITPVRVLSELDKLSLGGFATKKRPLADLSPLKGMKLTYLDCSYTQVFDLSPLKDMKLTWLDCSETLVSDLSPLKDMKLISLKCAGTRVSDLSSLKGLPLEELWCELTRVADLSPLKGMPLTTLSCGQSKVLDLSPLKGMKLEYFGCLETAVSDLSPLKDMPLTRLRIEGTPVSDLSPLKGMKLGQLNCGGTQVSDLSPLKDMKLTMLHCEQTAVTDLSLLKGMPLIDLGCDFKSERDTEILRSIKTLETINYKPAAEFWKDVAANQAKPAPTARADDPFQPKSVWVNREQNKALTVLERKGETFQARFVIGNNIDRIVSGTVKDGKVSWFSKDVRAVKGKVGDDNQGTFRSDNNGDWLDFTWASQGNVLGTFVLHRETNK